ncbi:MAG: ferritin family protein [candidate division Zixibacteria bacterium]|nr:ferritin family protein [candidate division Zixibacteria bacterium]
MEFNSMNEILDFAIGKEEEAYNLYRKIADSVKLPNMRQIFIDFANQEAEHKAKLLQVKTGKMELPADKTIKDLKIGDYLMDIEVASDLNYQQALIVAMKAEKNAFVMYTNLAAAAKNPNLKAMLLGLAAEEANHKLRIEMEYDSQIMIEN